MSAILSALLEELFSKIIDFGVEKSLDPSSTV
jgi:hypothetical protein